MLEEEFRKESDGRTYLLLKKTKVTFEEEMIRKTEPTGVLSMVRPERDDIYKYEITGRKSLAVTFERVPMNAEQIEKVLCGILDIIEGGKEYLLSEDNYILLPEHIYLQLPEYKVTLCYYPEYGVPFSEQLGKLFEILLNRVDYREERAIAMVYALYMQLQEPDVTLERIRSKLKEQVQSLKPENPVREKERQREEPEFRYVKYDESTGRKSVAEEKRAKTERKASPGTSLWERLRKEVGAKIYGREEKGKPAYAGEAVSCVCDTPSEWGTTHTKVLSVKKESFSPALRSAEREEKIFLTKFPFYVGSMPDYMDYVIDKDTVSRFHAKFMKQGEQVYLMDLNSTNGTRVNGRELNVRDRVLLAEGDRILFADAEYIFSEKERVEKG
ncbi:MAG: FHA domain-containing protein [Lachnospiraceae bacterium]|nr:FHA domain-containing protein [Lachnospiraceae bacterium]